MILCVPVGLVTIVGLQPIYFPQICTYLGGFWQVPQQRPIEGMSLSFVPAGLPGKPPGVHLHDWQGTLMFSFPWDEVTELTIGGPDEIKRRVTWERMLLTGPFAFAWTKEEKRAFLELGTNQGELLFEIRDRTLYEVRGMLWSYTNWLEQRSPEESE